jgi:hypothetical protein
MRVYFHLINSSERILDNTGIEVLNVEAAQHEALKAIRELRQEADHNAEVWHGWRLDAVDINDELLFSIPLDVKLH